MNAIIIFVTSLLVYYSGLMYLTRATFKKNNIKLSVLMTLFVPFYILKTYLSVAYKYKKQSRIRNHAILELLFGYTAGLAIFVEIVRFGFENKYIVSEKKKPNGLSSLISKTREPFSNTLNEYLAY